MVPGFTNNPAKDIIRRSWNTPVLKYLHDNYGIKYRYLGLPGPDIIDLLLWKDMIEEVIAFEPPDEIGSRRRSISNLRANLKRHLINGNAYWGSIEEVIQLREDYEGNKYSQNQIVTLYNLDFCDEITSKINTLESGRKALRYEAIRTILSDQKSAFLSNDRHPNSFILLITIRNQIGSLKLRTLLSDITNTLCRERINLFQSEFDNMPDNSPLIGSHAWAIKIFLFDFLCNCLYTPHISVLYFPVVSYAGTPARGGTIPSPMLHIMLFCQFADAESARPQIFPSNFLSCPSVKINNNNFIWIAENQTDSIPTNSPNPIFWLEEHSNNLLTNIVA
jgi:hypothetical protein